MAAGVAAEDAGFDGVTVSEHHAGFPGYLGQPVLVANWILAATKRVWAGPNPTLLGLRNPQLLAEELAWTAARFPDRVGATVVAGYARSDFDAVGVPYDDRLQRFPGQVRALLDALAPDGRLAGDAAVASFPGGVLQLGVNSTAACRRAAEAGLGIVFPGGEEGERLGTLTRAYREAGGAGTVTCIVNVGLGRASAVRRADEVFRRAADPSMRQAGGFRQAPFVGERDDVVTRIGAYLDAAQATAVNLRISRDVDRAGSLLEHVADIGGEVLPVLREHLAARLTA